MRIEHIVVRCKYCPMLSYSKGRGGCAHPDGFLVDANDDEKGPPPGDCPLKTAPVLFVAKKGVEK